MTWERDKIIMFISILPRGNGNKNIFNTNYKIQISNNKQNTAFKKNQICNSHMQQRVTVMSRSLAYLQ
jgi:hypothetical protein